MIELITLHTLDGRDVYVNPTKIVSVGEARDEGDPHKLTTGKVRCVINLLDGKVITVAEDCDNVRRRLQEINQE